MIFLFHILFVNAGNTFDNIIQKRFFISGLVYVLDTIRLNPLSINNMHPQYFDKRFTTYFSTVNLLDTSSRSPRNFGFGFERLSPFYKFRYICIQFYFDLPFHIKLQA